MNGLLKPTENPMKNDCCGFIVNQKSHKKSIKN